MTGDDVTMLAHEAEKVSQPLLDYLIGKARGYQDSLERAGAIQILFEIQSLKTRQRKELTKAREKK